jgi:hypothetical protein
MADTENMTPPSKAQPSSEHPALLTVRPKAGNMQTFKVPIARWVRQTAHIVVDAEDVEEAEARGREVMGVTDDDDFEWETMGTDNSLDIDWEEWPPDSDGEADTVGTSGFGMIGNAFADQLAACESCGKPVFTLLYDSSPVDADAETGFDPCSWMTIWADPLDEPLANGTHPTALCTACGSAQDWQRPRGILWRVTSGPGSLPALLVPPVDRPYLAMFDAVVWDDEAWAPELEFLALRGRWADDVELEGIALARLLRLTRKNGPLDDETEQVLRARELLVDNRLPWSLRVELHAEVGRSLATCQPLDALEHLQRAQQLSRDQEAQAEQARIDPDLVWNSPSVAEIAIDTAELAEQLEQDSQAFELLRWAVPACGENPERQKDGATLGIELALKHRDREAQLEFELIRLYRQYRDDAGPDLDLEWPTYEELLAGDATGALRQQMIQTVQGWDLRDAKHEVLRWLVRDG